MQEPLPRELALGVRKPLPLLPQLADPSAGTVEAVLERMDGAASGSATAADEPTGLDSCLERHQPPVGIFDIEAPDYDEARAFMTVRAALETALRSEEKAHAFFAAALPKIENATVKTLFLILLGLCHLEDVPGVRAPAAAVAERAERAVASVFDLGD